MPQAINNKAVSQLPRDILGEILQFLGKDIAKAMQVNKTWYLISKRFSNQQLAQHAIHYITDHVQLNNTELSVLTQHSPDKIIQKAQKLSFNKKELGLLTMIQQTQSQFFMPNRIRETNRITKQQITTAVVGLIVYLTHLPLLNFGSIYLVKKLREEPHAFYFAYNQSYEQCSKKWHSDDFFGTNEVKIGFYLLALIYLLRLALYIGDKLSQSYQDANQSKLRFFKSGIFSQVQVNTSEKTFAITNGETIPLDFKF